MTPVPKDPCESCQRAQAIVTVPGNHAAWNDNGPTYPIRLCAGCAILLPEGRTAVGEIHPQRVPDLV